MESSIGSVKLNYKNWTDGKGYHNIIGAFL